MAYETKLPRQASSSTVTEDFSEGSEVLPSPDLAVLSHSHRPPPCGRELLLTRPALGSTRGGAGSAWGRAAAACVLTAPWSLGSSGGFPGLSQGLGSFVTTVS